jgi:hypothetical protein
LAGAFLAGAALAAVFLVGALAFLVVVFLGALLVLLPLAEAAFFEVAFAAAFLAAGDFFSSSLPLVVAFFLEVDLMRLFFPIDNPFEIGWVLAYSAGLKIQDCKSKGFYKKNY